jgi:4-hydroxy-tetrahydrodipicolinate synthase
MVKSAERVTRAERKDWAREVMRGASSSLLPTFTPDLKALDEEAIRASVRNAKAQGYFAIGSGGTGCTPEERAQMLNIVLDEAGDDIEVYGGAGGNMPLADAIARLQELEALGISHFMMSFPRLATGEEIYNYCRDLVRSTNMAAMLYATGGNELRHIDPCNVPLDVCDKLGDEPNVVAMKLTQIMDPVTALMCAERLGDRILMGPVNLEFGPFLARHCQVQWTGVWAVDAVQSPEKPYVVEFMDLLRQNKIEEAEQYYFQFRPLLQLFWDVQAPWLRKGIHPQAHIKYYNWCVGGNGGLLRPPAADAGTEGFPPITAEDRKLIRDTYEAVGIHTSHLNEEEGKVGRTAYARGVRSADLAPNPTYI